MSVLLIVVPKNNVGLVKTLLVIPSSILKQIFLAFSPVFSPELFAVGGAFMRKKGLLNSGCGQLHMCEFNAEKQNKTKVSQRSAAGFIWWTSISDTDNPTATTIQHRKGDVESWRSFAWPSFKAVDLKFSSHVDGELVVRVNFRAEIVV